MTNRAGRGKASAALSVNGPLPTCSQCPELGNNTTLFIPRLFQNGSKDNSLDMLGTDIWAANTFDSFR